MRHFDFLTDAERRRLFLRAPQSFDLSSPLPLLGVALGATLYSPATRHRLAADIARRASEGVVSVVVCLEDAVADADLAEAELNAVAQLGTLADSGAATPMIFLRVRAPEQITMLVDALGERSRVVAGFVLPKFDERCGAAYLDAVVAAGERIGRRLLAMPVLESRQVIFAESRTETLLALRALVDKYREHVLALRVGATDLSAVYGLRRSRDLTVYDVRILADVIADVVNVFGRAEDGYVVSGPVWEYFSSTERMFKPQLRTSPFEEHSERRLRAELIARDLDGLIREVALDGANGLTGKTVIHPSHVAPVHALSVVTQEEFADATDILATSAVGGANSSPFHNKMNESKPHTAWAQRIALRAQVFGVAHEGISFVDLLAAGPNR